METIHIYHTNDLHSHFENWPRITNFLAEKKRNHHQRNESVFLFDIGDHVDLCHPYSEATKGEINTQLLNKESYHAATIGNNEGITLPFDSLNNLYQDAKFDVVIANLYVNKNERPNWAKAYRIYTTDSGVRIGVIGITACFGHLYELLGWNVTDPFAELEYFLPIISEQSDMVVVLSHLGIEEDEKMASLFPEIDVILGGHTHHVLQNGRHCNNSLIAAAGKFGYYVGHVTVTFDHKHKKVVDKQAVLYKTENLESPLNEQATIDTLYDNGKKLLSEKVGFLSASCSEKELAQILCEQLQKWCDADCAILNEGIIISSLKEGMVTYYDLLTICPHPINPCLIQLTGTELIQALNEIQDEKWENYELKGLGFRGKFIGKMITSNITTINGTYFLHHIGIEENQLYKVAIPDMFTFGEFFPTLFKAKQKDYYLPEFMRNILAETFQKASSLQLDSEFKRVDAE